MGKTRRVRKGGVFSFRSSKLTNARPPFPADQKVKELENGVRAIQYMAESENTKTRADLMKYVEKMKNYIQKLKFKTTGEFSQNNPMIKTGGKRTRKQKRRRMTRRRR